MNLTRLLLAGSRSTRPDGLIVTDDNLVEAVARGLDACGVRIPKDVAVVAHCNHPLPLPADLPFDWLGYDQGEILANAIDTLANGRLHKGRVPAKTIQPHWFHELSGVEGNLKPEVQIQR